MSFVPCNIYTFRRTFTNPTAVTQLQIKAAAAKPIVILGFGAEAVSAITIPASPVVGLQLGRIPTTFGTVTAAVAGDFSAENPGEGATAVQLGTAASGHTATVEPTYGDLWPYQWNLNGAGGRIYLPEERKIIAAATGVGLKSLVAPPAGTYWYWITYAEVG